MNAEPTRATTRRGSYLYGVTTTDTPVPGRLTGIEGGPVETVDVGSLRALVGRVEAATLVGADEGDRDADRARIGRTVQEHDAVLRALAAAGPVIPLRFGTLLQEDGDVAAFLREHRARLSTTLSRLEGAQEWGVRGHWSRAAQREHAASTLPPDSATSGTSGGGAAYLRARKRDRDLEVHTDRVRGAVVADCHRRLAAAARDATILAARAGTHREDLVLNGSYLVADDATDTFGEALRELSRTYGGVGLEFEATGPWPTYSFVGAETATGATP
jgi:hypothetical protein